MVIFTEGVFILIYKAQSAKCIGIPRQPFLPTCCSSVAGVSPMLSCSRLNRRPFGRNQSSCGGRMHVLTPTERTNMLRYLAITRSCNRSQESVPVLRLRLQQCIYCIDIIYIYIYISIIFYFCHWCSRIQRLARRGQPTVALEQYGRARLESAHCSAHHDKRAHRSARMARVLHLSH